MSAVMEIPTLAQSASDVSNGHYLKFRRLTGGQSFNLVVFPEISFQAKDFLPPVNV